MDDIIGVNFENVTGIVDQDYLKYTGGVISQEIGPGTPTNDFMVGKDIDAETLGNMFILNGGHDIVVGSDREDHLRADWMDVGFFEAFHFDFSAGDTFTDLADWSNKMKFMDLTDSSAHIMNKADGAFIFTASTGSDGIDTSDGLTELDIVNYLHSANVELGGPGGMTGLINTQEGHLVSFIVAASTDPDPLIYENEIKILGIFYDTELPLIA
jgi:hypothetical protein